MRITIFGGTGESGRLLVDKALAAGHHVVAYARSPEKLDARDRLEVVKGTLEDADAIARAVDGSTAVLSLLGPTRDKARSPQLVTGTEHIVLAMRDHGVERLVAVATPSAPDPIDGRDWRIRAMVAGIRLTLRTAYDTIRAMDATIRSSTLDWTIVRVPLLVDGDDERVRVRRIGEPGKLRLTRRALASFMLDEVDDRTWSKQAPFVSNP
jgi:uncharacterized protein YbjT (DUF2867 family)